MLQINDIVEFFEKRKDKSINEIAKDLLKEYDIRKKPEKSCFECIHYKRVIPGEITYVGGIFPKIENCNMGHEINRYKADYCQDYWRV